MISASWAVYHFRRGAQTHIISAESAPSSFLLVPRVLPVCPEVLGKERLAHLFSNVSPPLIQLFYKHAWVRVRECYRLKWKWAHEHFRMPKRLSVPSAGCCLETIRNQIGSHGGMACSFDLLFVKITVPLFSCQRVFRSGKDNIFGIHKRSSNGIEKQCCLLRHPQSIFLLRVCSLHGG